MWEEYALLCNPFSTEQQKISLYYTSDQNSSDRFLLHIQSPHTGFWVLLVPRLPLAVDQHSSLSPETHQSYSSSSLSACQLTTTWLGWQLLILQSSAPRSFPSRSHPWANNAQSKLAEGASLYLPSLYTEDHSVFFPELSKSETVLSLVHLLINGLLSFWTRM